MSAGEVPKQERGRIDASLELLHLQALILAVGAAGVPVNVDAADSVRGNEPARNGSAMPLVSPAFAPYRIRCRFLHQHQLLVLPIDCDRQRIGVHLAPEGVQDTGKHGDPLLGEGPDRFAPTTVGVA